MKKATSTASGEPGRKRHMKFSDDVAPTREEEYSLYDDLTHLTEEDRQRVLMERERRQREENEETTKSEDLANLRRMLQSMTQQRISGTGTEFETQRGATRNVVDSQLEISISPTGIPTILEGSIDGGWGWLVVMGSFLFISLVDGICFTCGLLVPDLRDYFELHNLSVAMLPASLATGMCILAGPLASLMANSFEYRPVAMLGCIGATVALALCSYVTRFTFFIIFFGLLCGVSFGLIYLPAIAVISNWFQQRRAIAVGFVLCGSGIGTMLFAQTTPVALKQIALPELLLIWATVSAQCLLAVVTYRPLDVHQRLLMESAVRQERRAEKRRLQCIAKERKLAARLAKAQKVQQRHRQQAKQQQRGNIMQRIIEEKERQRTNSIGSLDGMVLTQHNELVESLPGQYTQPLITSLSINRIAESVYKRHQKSNALRKEAGVMEVTELDKNSVTQMVQDYVSQWSLQQQQQQQQQQGAGLMSRVTSTNNSYLGHRFSGSVPRYYPQRRASVPARFCTFKVQPVYLNMSSRRYSIEEAHRQQSASAEASGARPRLTTNSNNSSNSARQSLQSEIQAALYQELNRPMYKKDMFFSGSSIKLSSSDLSGLGTNDPAQLQSSQLIMTNSDYQQASFQPGIDSGADHTMWFFMDMFHPQLLTSPTFLLLALSCTFGMLGFFVPFHYVPSHPWYVQQAARIRAGHVISAMGVANIVGRLLTTAYMENNMVSYARLLDSLWVHNTTLGLAMVSILVMGLCGNLLVCHIILCGTFSCCMAISISLKSVIVVELFGIDRLTNAFCYLLLFQGVAVITSTPLAVYLMTVLKNNAEVPFYFCAVCVCLSLLGHLPLRYVADWERHRLERRYGVANDGDDETWTNESSEQRQNQNASNGSADVLEMASIISNRPYPVSLSHEVNIIHEEHEEDCP